MIDPRTPDGRDLATRMLTASRFRACPVCAGARVEVLRKHEVLLPNEFRLPSVFDVVACAACGMVYYDWPSDAIALSRYYAAPSYVFGTWAEQERPDPATIQAGSPRDIDRLRGSVVALGDVVAGRGLRILDAGCNSGDLLGLLRTAGFTDAHGIDPSPNAVAIAQSRGYDAQVGSLDEIPAGLGMYDIVMSTHVFEHLAGPAAALSGIRSVLRPGGLLYVEVPDATRYAELIIEPFHEFSVEHINHFGIEQLDLLMRRQGFELVASGRNDCEVGSGWPFPAIFGVWRKTETVAEAIPAFPSNPLGLRDCMLRYIEESHALIGGINERIAARLAGRRRVAVRCLGYRAETLLANSILSELDIVAYIDREPKRQGLTYRGIRAIGPEVKLADDVPVVVLAYHTEAAVVAEYAQTDPGREVIALGRSRVVAAASAAR